MRTLKIEAIKDNKISFPEVGGYVDAYKNFVYINTGKGYRDGRVSFSKDSAGEFELSFGYHFRFKQNRLSYPNNANYFDTFFSDKKLKDQHIFLDGLWVLNLLVKTLEKKSDFDNTWWKDSFIECAICLLQVARKWIEEQTTWYEYIHFGEKVWSCNEFPLNILAAKAGSKTVFLEATRETVVNVINLLMRGTLGTEDEEWVVKKIQTEGIWQDAYRTYLRKRFNGTFVSEVTPKVILPEYRMFVLERLPHLGRSERLEICHSRQGLEIRFGNKETVVIGLEEAGQKDVEVGDDVTGRIKIRLDVREMRIGELLRDASGLGADNEREKNQFSIEKLLGFTRYLVNFAKKKENEDQLYFMAETRLQLERMAKEASIPSEILNTMKQMDLEVEKGITQILSDKERAEMLEGYRNYWNDYGDLPLEEREKQYEKDTAYRLLILECLVVEGGCEPFWWQIKEK